jgi:hypothetical protein
MPFRRPINPMIYVMKYILDFSSLVITVIFLELKYSLKCYFKIKNQILDLIPS